MPLAIIGMHRSGTSLVARLLNIAGLYLGDEDDFYPASESNVRGHWEHLAFLEGDEAFLESLGGTHLEPPLFEGDWLSTPQAKEFSRSIKSEVASIFKGHPVWGWKEPRTSLLVSLYRKIIPNLRYVVCLRNPLDVAESLQARNKISVKHGVALWHYYTQLALEATKPDERFLVEYNDYLDNPIESVERTIRLAGLPQPEPGSDTLKALHESVDKQLKHHGHTLADVLESEDVLPETKRFYQSLSEGWRDQTFTMPSAADLQAVHHVIATEGVSRLVKQAAKPLEELKAEFVKVQAYGDQQKAWAQQQTEGVEWLQKHCKDLEAELGNIRPFQQMFDDTRHWAEYLKDELKTAREWAEQTRVWAHETQGLANKWQYELSETRKWVAHLESDLATSQRELDVCRGRFWYRVDRKLRNIARRLLRRK